MKFVFYLYSNIFGRQIFAQVFFSCFVSKNCSPSVEFALLFKGEEGENKTQAKFSRFTVYISNTNNITSCFYYLIRNSWFGMFWVMVQLETFYVYVVSSFSLRRSCKFLFSLMDRTTSPRPLIRKARLLVMMRTWFGQTKRQKKIFRIFSALPPFDIFLHHCACSIHWTIDTLVLKQESVTISQVWVNNMEFCLGPFHIILSGDTGKHV